MAQSDSFSDDLAYVRDLAERGEAAPLIGGRFALWWGGLTAAMMLLHWSARTGNAPFPIDYIGLAWIAYGMIGGLGTWALDALFEDAAGASAVNNRLASTVWTMIGIPIFLYAVGVGFGVGLGVAPMAAFDTILGVAFALYTLAFYAVGRFSRDKVMLGFAAISALATLVSGLLIGQPTLYLAAAAFVLLTAGGSGVYQMARAPKATV